MFVFLGYRKEHAFVRKIFWANFGLVILALSASPSLYAKRVKRTRPKSALQRKNQQSPLKFSHSKLGDPGN